jgi:hypothetical protein
VPSVREKEFTMTTRFNILGSLLGASIVSPARPDEARPTEAPKKLDRSRDPFRQAQARNRERARDATAPRRVGQRGR